MPAAPTFDLEREFAGLGGPVAGVDEVGRGPWAGPVVAAAVVLDPATAPEGLADSKALAAKRREALSASLHEVAEIGLGLASVEEIDRLNIGQATLLAMVRAVDALPRAPAAALVDGNRPPRLACRVRTVVRGDQVSASIAAASIVAKVARDRMMTDLAAAFPGYGWEKNKGYGAPAHRKGLDRLGVTQHHRRSFAPIAALVERAA
ncbi:MAG: ribonuclease HII [Pseudomonadota bacterium]